MASQFKFEKLIIWQKAIEFGEHIFQFTKAFPKDEVFNLTSQARRAADSIALNIAEGSTGQSNAEFRRFMGYAIRSLAEVITCLHKAKHRNYVSPEQFDTLYDEAFHLMNMTTAFKKSIK